MEEDVLEKLLTKLIGLSEFGALRWHFAGDVSKAYVTVYRDSRLKLTDKMLDITELEGDTVRLDSRLHQEPITTLLANLYKAAQESSGRFRTGAVKQVSSTSLVSTCQKLLDENTGIELPNCLVCSTKFDPNKSYNHIAHKDELTSKRFYICQDCVSKLGLAQAQAQMEKHIRTSRNSDEAIMGDTNPGLSKNPINKIEMTTENYLEH